MLVTHSDGVVVGNKKTLWLLSYDGLLQKIHGDPVILQEDDRVRAWVSSSAQGNYESTEMEHSCADKELEPEIICFYCRCKR